MFAYIGPDEILQAAPYAVIVGLVLYIIISNSRRARRRIKELENRLEKK